MLQKYREKARLHTKSDNYKENWVTLYNTGALIYIHSYLTDAQIIYNSWRTKPLINDYSISN